MKKWIYTLSFVIIFILAICIGTWLFNLKEKNQNNKIQNTNFMNNIVQERNDDMQNEITIQTTIEEEKISPNAILILKKQYKECNHIIKEYAEIPEDFVNLTEEEIKKEYPEWEVENFDAQEITLLKKEDGFCNEHYLLKPKDGQIAIYNINKNGEETLIETTGISIDYLTPDDKTKISQGIKVYGKEELNSTLEDYE